MSTNNDPPPGAGIDYSSLVGDATTWTSNGWYTYGGGVGGSSGYPYIYTLPSAPTTITLPTLPNPLDALLAPSGGPNKLTPPQLSRLMSGHRFIQMDNSDYCLFCYALDMYRNRTDHLFVISEE